MKNNIKEQRKVNKLNKNNAKYNIVCIQLLKYIMIP